MGSGRECGRDKNIALIELLESRLLLSAYTISTLYGFSGSDGSSPQGALIADANGNLYGTTNVGGRFNIGTVFELTAGARALITLATFNAGNGSNPVAGLVMDSAGNLYGTTYESGDGNVFEIAAGTHAFTTLMKFSGNGGPTALTIDANGNLYGTLEAGGGNAKGAVYEIAANTHTYSTLANFSGANGQNPAAGLVVDSSGNLFGTTYGGGDLSLSNGYGDGTVFELAAGSHSVATLAAFNGSDGQFPTTSLVEDSNGNLFGTTPTGGVGGAGTVFEVASGTHTLTTLVNFSGANGNPQSGVIIDQAGNLFGTTYGTSGNGATGFGMAYEVVANTHAVNVLVTFNLSNGASPAADLLADSHGNLFGTTFGGVGPNGLGTIFELSPIGASQVAFAAEPSPTTIGRLFTPVIAVDVDDSNGHIISGDSSSVTISILNGPAGAVLGGTLTVQAVNGVAAFSNLTLNKLGNYTLKVVDGSLISATSSVFSVVSPGVATPVYRLYSPVTQEHLYTMDANENRVLGTEGWNQEGSPFSEYNGPTILSGVSDEPLYRLYDKSNAQHLWTTDLNEYNTLRVLSNWSDEGIAGYVFATQVAASTPLYRLSYPFSPFLHLWTTDLNEYNVLGSSDGWIREGAIGYVVAS